jgi:dihydroorotate dehydrogenase electron transfer subunit
MLPANTLPAGPNEIDILEHEALILHHAAVNADYRLMEVSAPEQAKRAVAGQFFHLLCPHKGGVEPFFRRPMSIYRIDREAGTVSFLYKVTGAGTKALAAMSEGETLNILGPLGIGFSLPERREAIVILARGVGLATLAPLVAHAAERGHPVTAILSARSPEYLMSVEEMRADGAQVITVVDSDMTSEVDRVEDLLHGLRAQGRMGAIYTCGSNRLLLAAQAVAKQYGIHGEVAMEQQMACGLGMCFCCVRPFQVGNETVHRRVCCEGPVFPLSEAMGW